MSQENYLLISDDGPGFYTLEGEGELVGKPSVFLRLFGCNLTCKGFASEDAPWGCDSYISWSKKNKYSFDQMFEFYVKNNFISLLMDGVILKITGGEPMLRQKPLKNFIRQFKERYDFIPTIDFETNGTIKPDEEWVSEFEATFTVSPKMSNNGDPRDKRYAPDVLDWHCRHNSCFKFVISSEEDVEELHQDYLNSEKFYISPNRVWLMPCAGSRQEHIERAEKVAELCKKYKFNFSPRLHLLLWDKALKV